MSAPVFLGAQDVARDTLSFSAQAVIGDLGTLQVNAFLIRAAEPVLIDTGLGAVREPFLAALAQTIDPEDIRWIWLSHMDEDHIGNLNAVLELAPKARIVTNFLGAAKLALRGFDLSRLHLLEPGASLDAGDRLLTPIRPPYYDAPETMGFADSASGVLYTGDAFGALVSEVHDDAAALSHEALRDGMDKWTALDAPWLELVDTGAFRRRLGEIERSNPAAIISAHLPVARAMTRSLIETLVAVVEDRQAIGARLNAAA